MSDGGLERLLWEEIDGALSEAERSRLAERLEADGEARKLGDEVGEMARLLSDAEDVTPPPELRLRIRTALAERPVPGSPRSGRRPWWSPAAWGAGSSSRYAYLAAGIVIGVVSVLLVGRGMDSGGSEALVGTVNVAADAAPGEWREFALGDARGSVRLRRQGEIWTAAFDVTPGPEISVRFLGADGAVPLVGATSEAGGAALAGDGPRQRALEVYAARPGEGPIRLVVESAGRVLLERELASEE